MMGIIPIVAQKFSVSIDDAGWSVSVFSLVVVLCAYCDFAWNDMFVCVDICVCKARGCAVYICSAAWNLGWHCE